MEIPVGTVLYRYTIRNKKLHINEGVVANYGLRTCVNFRDDRNSVRAPRMEELGVIRTVGHSLWMKDRDDKLAIRKFISFEEKKLAEMEQRAKAKRELVAMLQRELSKME